MDYARLSRAAQIDFEIFRQDLTRSIWLAQNTHPFQEDPRVYDDYISDSVYLLLTQSTLPPETNIANCLARMALIPRVVAAAKENLRNPPRVCLETAIRQNQGAIGFFEQDLFQFAGQTPQMPALKSAAARVADCLKGYQKLLEHDLLPQADWPMAAWARTDSTASSNWSWTPASTRTRSLRTPRPNSTGFSARCG